jgi:hypothetical protein
VLSGDAGQPGAREALIRLLAATTAPARPHELAGEDAAVAAFLRAGPAPARRTGRRALIAKLLTVKLAAAFAVTAAGGAALAAAAATGTLPEIPGTPGAGTRPYPPAVPAPPSSQAATRGPGILASPQAPKAGQPSVPAASPSASPDPSLVALCRALISDARGGSGGGKRKDDLSDPTFAPLVAPAGGKAEVGPFCLRLLREHGVGDAAPPGASPTPSPAPGHQGQPGDDNNQIRTNRSPDPRWLWSSRPPG